jgi:putative aminopeptidase FrvX
MSVMGAYKRREGFRAGGPYGVVARLRFARRTLSASMALLVAAQLLAFGISAASAQESDVAKLGSWVALDAPTGHEYLATRPLSQALDGWRIDRNGNLAKTTGEGSPHRIVACGLDWNAYAVTQITDDGYLRLHGIGRGTGHALWDQAHEGQQVRVLTRAGPIVGVVGIANAHFAQQHRNETAIVTADDLWVDVGASSAEDVTAMGIELLDPVVRNVPAWSYAREVAGPGAGARAGCAAVAAAAEAAVGSGTITWVLSTQRVFGWVGLGAALSRSATVDELIVLAPGDAVRRDELLDAPPDGRLTPVTRFAGVESMRLLAPRVDDAGSLVERIDLAEAEELMASLLAAVGAPIERVPPWIGAPAPALPRNDEVARVAGRRDGARLGEIARLLEQLVETPGVPGHEGPVRAIVLEELPAWARERVQTDELGNVWVAAGPDGESTVFMAHMDEVAWVVEEIDRDGTVSLTPRGGVIPSAWEGQIARVQLDAGTGAASAARVDELNGVFVTRNEPEGKRPGELAAWFGMRGSELVAAGLRPGMGVTGYKQGYRIGPYRYTARSLDDRAGTTALLMAIKALDLAGLDHRVIFAWSVREETGLIGASAMAEGFGASARRVYSVDTFVSSDTPLESPHFAYAPLGAGPVLRSIENTSMATPFELDRNRSIASEAGIAVQIGLTQGGTDGTMFTFWGAPNAGLSWPGRYSHSPAEVLDLRDLAALVDLIGAMAVAAP